MVTSKRPIVTIKSGCSCSMPGVWRAVAHNKGAVVIYHSPKGCGHVTHDMDLGGHYRALVRGEFDFKQYQAPLIISDLKEEHSIFGGAEQLRKCIAFAVEKYKPEYIMIANSCVSGVIGDDTQAVAIQAEHKWGIPIMAVPCCGFLDSDYYAGFYYAGRLLIEKFMSPQPKIQNTVTLVGERGGPESRDVKEIEALLREFGLNIQCHFPGYTSVAKLKKVPSSAMSIVIGGRPQSYDFIRKLGEDLQNMFKVAFFDNDYPVGLEGTKLWINNLGKFLNREKDALRIAKEQETRFKKESETYYVKLKNLRAVLCIGRPLEHFQPDWVLELIAKAGMLLEGIILLKGLTIKQQEGMKQKLHKYTKTPIFDQIEGEAAIQTADMVITTHELDADTKRQLFLPILPPVGVGGMVELLEKMARLSQRSGQRGGIIYG